MNQPQTTPPAQPLDPEFLALLACPQCKGNLVLRESRLLCKACRLAYRIEEGIPNMLVEEAERITDAELAGLG